MATAKEGFNSLILIARYVPEAPPPIIPIFIKE